MKKRYPVAAILALSLCGSVAAERYSLPENLLVRKPGLWEVTETGTVGPNKVSGKKQYCLDAQADKALHELDVLRKELLVVHSDISCKSPQFDVDGPILSGYMACRTNSAADDEAAGEDFHWEMDFSKDSEVQSTSQDTPKDVPLLTVNDMSTVQKRLGDCPADMAPGDYIDFGFSYGKQKFQSKPRRDNIHESIKTVTKLLNQGIEINKRLGAM